MPIIHDPQPSPGAPPIGEVSAILGDLATNVTNEYGVQVDLVGLDGWWESPDSTGTTENRAHDHGGWMGPAYLAPRVIEIQLYLHGTGWAYLNRTIDQVMAAIPLQDLTPLYVEDFGPVTMAMVRQEGAPLVREEGVGWRVSISLVAPDSRRYSIHSTTLATGLPVTSGGLSLPISLPLTIGATVESGVLSATNEGNFGTRPTLTVTGPVEPFTITHKGTGQTLRYHETLPANRTLVIDTDTRRALLDGTAARRVTGQWFEYGPGLNEIAFSSQTYNASALLTSTHSDAWR